MENVLKYIGEIMTEEITINTPFNDVLGHWFNGCDNCEHCKHFNDEILECIFVEEII